ncbi:hypothetical protein ACFL0W_06315 [Nanoarchaeota archaeon]
MKAKIDNLKTVYATCNSEGLIKPKEKTDIELIKSLFDSAKEGFERIEYYDLGFEKKRKNFAFLFRDHYEVLRMLIDVFLFFDKIAISNHQCSSAYLCTNHPELEFDWDILETMRILRNAINYEGKKINLEKWNNTKIQFKVYISTLRKAIQEKLKE